MWSRSLYIVWLVQHVVAQQNTFQWGFIAGDSPPLPECGSVGVSITETTLSNQPGSGQAPFYMMAYEPGGPTTNTLLTGSDTTNLAWTITHAAGKQLLLQVADSQGNTGGVGPQLYSVTSGSSTSCHPSNPSSPVQLTTTTTSLQTCDPLVLDISGGSKPYTVTIVARDAQVVTNITMGPNDNEYTWINRAAPGSFLIAAVSDSTGQYSLTTNLISLSGPTDTTCSGQSSFSGVKGSSTSSVDTSTQALTPISTSASTSTNSLSPSLSATSSPKSKSNIGAIAGGAAGGAVALIGLAALVFFCLRRKRSKADSGGYSPASKHESYRVADESFATRPSQPPASMQDYAVNQYVFAPGSEAGQARPSVHLNYAPNTSSYYDPSSSSASLSRMTDSTVKTPPQSVMYAHNLPGASAAYSQQYAQFGAVPNPMGPSALLSKEPPSVTYAKGRASALSQGTSSAAMSQHGGYPSGGIPEESSELAYRTSGGSNYDFLPFPQPQSQMQSQSSYASGLPKGAGAPVPQIQPEIVQHRDAGPVVEVPPAYGDQQPT